MEDAIIESVEAAGDVANNVIDAADTITTFILWANENPRLFRIILLAIIILIIAIPCVYAYKWNRPK